PLSEVCGWLGPGSQATSWQVPPPRAGAAQRSSGPSAVFTWITPCALLAIALGSFLPRALAICVLARFEYRKKDLTEGGAGWPSNACAIAQAAGARTSAMTIAVAAA